MSYKPPKPQNIGKVGYDGTGNKISFDSPGGRRVINKQRRRIEWSRKYGFGG